MGAGTVGRAWDGIRREVVCAGLWGRAMRHAPATTGLDMLGRWWYVAASACHPTGVRANIRSGVGRSSWSISTGFDGDLGRGTGSQREGVVVRVVSMGNNVLESPCATGGSFIGRVSVADASLSLSLSRPSRRQRASRQIRGLAPRPTGQRARSDLSCAHKAHSFLFVHRRGPCARGGSVLPGPAFAGHPLGCKQAGWVLSGSL